jgi:hypothetical protein
MATTTAETAVRNYLTGLRDPGALRNEEELQQLTDALDSTDDMVERIRLRQQILDLDDTSLERHEHAFLAEGVPPQILRRAGFRVGGRGGGRGGARKSSGGQKRTNAPRSRVTAEEIRKAIPKGTFTIKQVQESTGASLASVRKVIEEGVSGGTIQAVGPSPDHSGPGRAPNLYKRGK